MHRASMTFAIARPVLLIGILFTVLYLGSSRGPAPAPKNVTPQTDETFRSAFDRHVRPFVKVADADGKGYEVTDLNTDKGFDRIAYIAALTRLINLPDGYTVVHGLPGHPADRVSNGNLAGFVVTSDKASGKPPLPFVCRIADDRCTLATSELSRAEIPGAVERVMEEWSKRKSFAELSALVKAKKADPFFRGQTADGTNVVIIVVHPQTGQTLLSPASHRVYIGADDLALEPVAVWRVEKLRGGKTQLLIEHGHPAKERVVTIPTAAPFDIDPGATLDGEPLKRLP